MRLFLLRILLGWWIIPAFWIILWPLVWLLTGSTREAATTTKELCHDVWFGDLS